jgi:RES domain-containing protein
MVSQSKGAIETYRIADIRHPIFDGTGAMLMGGRWNSPGHMMIYTSKTYSGAMLEKLVHSNGIMPKNHHSILIRGAEVSIEEVTAENLPDWDSSDELASKAYGDDWCKSKRTLVLIVPSVVARQEKNILINQTHPEFQLLTASEPEPVVWDDRLFQRLKQ